LYQAHARKNNGTAPKKRTKGEASIAIAMIATLAFVEISRLTSLSPSIHE
jgi:hypothetical protein